MQSFLRVLSVSELVHKLLAIPPLPYSNRSLTEIAHTGGVLGTSLLSPEDLPVANRSGMDGYAVQAADLFGASEFNPVWLDCIGHISIDKPEDFVLASGQCASIVTGGHLPAGADAVIMVEHTKPFGAGVVEMRRSVAPGEYVMFKGDDAQAGQEVLPCGTLLRPQELGLLAALGITEAPVIRRPRVAILSTGDELVPPDAVIRPGQIRDVNTLALIAMLSRIADVRSFGIAGDQLSDISEKLRQAAAWDQSEPADVVFISGGSSVGIRDLTLTAIQSLGNMELLCHGVALSPGKPLIVARSGQTTFWGLPGQVASAQVVMHVLGIPFIRHISGHSLRFGNAFEQRLWTGRQARLTRNIASRQGREDYVRVRLHFEDQGGTLPQAIPVPGLSGLLRTLLDADGIIRIPADLEGIEAGTLVDVLLFDPYLTGEQG